MVEKLADPRQLQSFSNEDFSCLDHLDEDDIKYKIGNEDEGLAFIN